jgi:hypothetical protein
MTLTDFTAGTAIPNRLHLSDNLRRTCDNIDGATIAAKMAGKMVL